MNDETQESCDRVLHSDNSCRGTEKSPVSYRQSKDPQKRAKLIKQALKEIFINPIPRTITQVSKRYDIPYNTLKTRVKKSDKVVISNYKLRHIFTDQYESLLCDYLTLMYRCGVLVSYREVLSLVNDTVAIHCKRSNIENPLNRATGTRLGRRWWKEFYQRMIDSCPVLQTVQENAYSSHTLFGPQRKILNKHQWLKSYTDSVTNSEQKHSLIFHAHEMRFKLGELENKEKVWTSELEDLENNGHNFKFSKSENFAILETINTEGNIRISPFVITEQSGLQKNLDISLGQSKFDEEDQAMDSINSWQFHYAKNGCLTPELFLKYLAYFHSQLKLSSNNMIDESYVKTLVVNIDSSLITLDTVFLLNEFNIQLMILPRDMVHLKLSIDEGIFGPLMRIMDGEMTRLLDTEHTNRITITDFFLYFVKVKFRLTTSFKVRQAFQNLGLDPPNYEEFINSIDDMHSSHRELIKSESGLSRPARRKVMDTSRVLSNTENNSEYTESLLSESGTPIQNIPVTANDRNKQDKQEAADDEDDSSDISYFEELEEESEDFESDSENYTQRFLNADPEVKLDEFDDTNTDIIEQIHELRKNKNKLTEIILQHSGVASIITNINTLDSLLQRHFSQMDVLLQNYRLKIEQQLLNPRGDSRKRARRT
ncbi:Hypothetical protein PP7435_CHR1-0725 [Komagataella phaffii CBS 7435]|uniref:DDE-1 domain-containing protein n=2 Tax=Komagataella phaffii TaxID=460519 RepID=C4QX10_KOMPG|nr:Hypothetical protein PAS_chr1-1_0406 [Komagataella phaffii GS115]CAH2446581.1 Hypothetical protein BQ9382_C1-3745 [Komagataella phaffii CBS 7435]CAY67783.1 Hypothetical protein PAS_chr1-1_0406 [Komagataella phaffii GS115]CCA36868.1 Hypothetical protein PP7435_CHR1-0725 [Komagataella phaffii CBS 7435]